MIKNRIVYISVIATVCLLAACSDVLSKFKPSAKVTTDEDSVPLSLQYSDPEQQDFLNNIQTKLKERDFQALETLSKTYREKKERFKGGAWKIYSFYRIVSSPVSDKPIENDWAQHIAFLRQWKTNLPESITAPAALAEAYMLYAWQARGDGFVGSVSKENWRTFEERVGIAAKELSEAAKIEGRCYGYYDTWLSIANAQAWNNERYNKIFDEAVQYDASYQYFYRAKAHHLLPRWHGEPGEWEDFADNVKTKLGEREGLKMYYQIVANMSRFHGSSFFTANRVSWEETKKGFALFEDEFGMSREKLNEFGRMAIHAGDVQMSCKTFLRLKGDNDFEPDVWQNRKNFDTYRSRALQMCTVPKSNNPNQ